MRRSLKRPVLYPFLFAIYIILSPLADNLDQLDPGQAARPLAILLGATAAGMLLGYLLFRDWQYAGHLVFLGLAFFFLFGHLYRVVQGQIPGQDQNTKELLLLAVWAVVLGVLSIKLVWTRLGGPSWMVSFFNLVFGLALVVPGYRVLAEIVSRPPQAAQAQHNPLPDTGDPALDCRNRPDIYLVILDAYGRADVLDGLYGLDNGPFLDYLAGKGFYVAGESHTNYIQTVYSIPAVLNFAPIRAPGERVNGAQYFRNLVRDNRIMRVLEQCGYQTVAIESGFYFTSQPEVDVYYSQESDVNPFERLLISGSPLDALSDELGLDPPPVESYAAHRERVLYSLDKLESVARTPGPKIVFAHIITPHPPFVFDPDGRPIDPERDYSLGDGEDYTGSLDEYRQGYANQVRFVNGRLEKIIDRLLAHSDTPPVIIVMGDHGPGSRLNWGSVEQSCLWERTSILNALYLPGAGREALYPSISPMNSFRVVLNSYFGADLSLLPDRTYFTSYQMENQVIDITAERSSQRNCR